MLKRLVLAITLITILILAGCSATINKKYIEIVIEKDAELKIEGGIDPQFLREGTEENPSTTVTPDIDGVIDIPNIPFLPIP